MSEHFLKVLRNGELFASHELALTGLKGKLGGLTDGEIAVASYGDSFANAKTIFGVVRVSGDQKSYEIFDNEGKTSEVSTKIAEEIAKLDADVTSADGGKVKVNVVEVDGKITEVTVTESDIASAAKLTEVEGKVDVNKAAIEKLNGADSVEGSVAKSIKDAIEGLDVTEVGGNGKVITTISETDGKIAATAIDLKAENVAATVITGDDAKVGVTGTTVAAQIESLAGSIKTVEGNAAKYKVVALTAEEIGKLEGGANVKEAYKVVSYTGEYSADSATQVGETVKIYKDATLESVTFSDQKLHFTYILADGTTSQVDVDMSALVLETEVKNGIALDSNDKKIYVKLDDAGENFLTVGEDGVKLSGVQAAINAASAGAKATVAHNDGNTHVTVSSTTADDGHVDYVVNETDIASAALLGTADDTADKDTAFGKIAKNKAAIDELSGDAIKTVTVNDVEAEVAENAATVTIDGNDIAVADTYTAVEYAEPFNSKTGVSKVDAEDKVDEAFAKVEGTVKVLVDEVLANEEVVSKAVEKLATAAGTIDGDGNISYTKKTDANYIKDATSLHDATVKLDEALKTVSDSVTTADTDMLTSVAAGNGISVTEKNDKSQTISAKLNTTKTDNALSVDADGLYLSNVWDCGTY